MKGKGHKKGAMKKAKKTSSGSMMKNTGGYSKARKGRAKSEVGTQDY